MFVQQCCVEMIVDSDTLLSSLSADSPALSSALQVFSSVGGLALLAEHLPLLYPDFSRHSSPVDIVRDTANTNVSLPSAGGVGIGHDWVTVESAEEIYEVCLKISNVYDLCSVTFRFAFACAGPVA